MKKIPLPQGADALVSDEDYDYVAQFCWQLHMCNSGPMVAMNPGGNGQVYMHRIILERMLGRKLLSWEREQVDHINGVGLDNQRENLHLATGSQNAANAGKKRRKGGTSSRFKGVSWWASNGRWKAKITKDYKDYYLGYFAKEEDAARAYDAAAVDFFGEFALTNAKLGLLP